MYPFKFILGISIEENLGIYWYQMHIPILVTKDTKITT